MADTQNSWKQLLKAKQGFEQLNEVIVGPQGGAQISLREAVIVTEGVACTVTAKDKDKVTINAEVCCPPIEFTNIMGEQDINRPGVTREDWARVIWNTNSPTTSRLTWGPEGSPTAALVTGSSVESKQHELFFQGVAIGSRYDFIVGGCRAFCGDCASSPVYSFGVQAITEVAISVTFSVEVLTALVLCSSTTVNLTRPTHWFDWSSTGGQAGTSRPIGLSHSIATTHLSGATVSQLSTSDFFVTTAVTTVP